MLPIGGHPKTWSGISVRDFKKRSSVIYLTREGFADMAPHASTLAKYEGFPAHMNALKHKNDVQEKN